MSKKIYWCVVGTLNGKTFSKPGFENMQVARDYAYRKGWIDVEVLCEGSKEG